MIQAMGAFGSLFAAVFICLTGNGLLNTLLSARMAMDGYSMVTMGVVLSCYFSGLLAGSFVCHRLIQRIGHIRAFAVFAAGTTVAALVHGIFLSPWVWGGLRFSCGVTTFGLFMTMESWLNECAEAKYRGRVFSIYMILSFLGIGIGQQLLNAGDIQGNELFIIAGVIFAMCLIPVAATDGVHPRLPGPVRFSFIVIFRKAPLGMLGSMAAGLTNSAFYAMMPVVCSAVGLSHYQLSWIMSITVFAGLTAQFLVGAVSDRFDRAMVLTIVVVSIVVVSGFLFFDKDPSFIGLIVKMAMIGALIFSVYPLAVARTHDIFGGQDTIAVSTGLLFAYSTGASVSPLLASGMMTLVRTPLGLFAFWCSVHFIFAGMIFYLRTKEKLEIVPVEDQVSFVPMKRTSPVAMELDPRTDPTEDVKEHSA